jgi:hypothetical protein
MDGWRAPVVHRAGRGAIRCAIEAASSVRQNLQAVLLRYALRCAGAIRFR